MPIWDSVHKSLEKASQEAARIAKTQRFRATIDGLSYQINIQSTNLVNKTMEMFMAGQLTQHELLPLCQELANLQQQLQQIQTELKQHQASQPPQPALSGPQPTLPAEYLSSTVYAPPPPETVQYITASGEPLPSAYAPPPPEYQTHIDVSNEAAPPPPPSTLTGGSLETVLRDANAPAIRRCPVCQFELRPNHAFCQNCGTHVQEMSSQHLPTVRANIMDAEPDSSDDETRRANSPSLLRDFAPPVSDSASQQVREEGV